MQPLRVDPTLGTTADTLGLRERKKLQARRRIAHAAHELFAARGFDHVTIGDVAVAADVSVKTVFNYFGTKEDLAFEGEDQVIAGWLNAIRHRPPGTTPLDAVRAIIDERFDGAVADRLDAFAGLVAASPDLQSRLRLLWDRLEEAVTRVLVAEAVTADDGEADLLAVAAARVEAAQVVSVPRLFVSDDVRAFVAHAGDSPAGRAAAVATWLDRAFATLAPAVADAR